MLHQQINLDSQPNKGAGAAPHHPYPNKSEQPPTSSRMRLSWLDTRSRDNDLQQADIEEVVHQRVDAIVSDDLSLSEDRHVGYPINEFCLEK
ncbi:hypothetical protein [Streptomyces sp. YGL11-2]|uniref:hypothetical protein n=1 Tax=Streptomyces sp. YGL11-2 TaxID=3414028 RepID=UPI003CF2BAA4